MPYDQSTYQSNTHADTTWCATEFGFSAQWDIKKGIKEYMEWLYG